MSNRGAAVAALLTALGYDEAAKAVATKDSLNTRTSAEGAGDENAPSGGQTAWALSLTATTQEDLVGLHDPVQCAILYRAASSIATNAQGWQHVQQAVRKLDRSNQAASTSTVLALIEAIRSLLWSNCPAMSQEAHTTLSSLWLDHCEADAVSSIFLRSDLDQLPQVTNLCDPIHTVDAVAARLTLERETASSGADAELEVDALLEELCGADAGEPSSTVAAEAEKVVATPSMPHVSRDLLLSFLLEVSQAFDLSGTSLAPAPTASRKVIAALFIAIADTAFQVRDNTTANGLGSLLLHVLLTGNAPETGSQEGNSTQGMFLRLLVPETNDTAVVKANLIAKLQHNSDYGIRHVVAASKKSSTTLLPSMFAKPRRRRSTSVSQASAATHDFISADTEGSPLHLEASPIPSQPQESVGRSADSDEDVGASDTVPTAVVEGSLNVEEHDESTPINEEDGSTQGEQEEDEEDYDSDDEGDNTTRVAASMLQPTGQHKEPTFVAFMGNKGDSLLLGGINSCGEAHTAMMSTGGERLPSPQLRGDANTMKVGPRDGCRSDCSYLLASSEGPTHVSQLHIDAIDSSGYMPSLSLLVQLDQLQTVDKKPVTDFCLHHIVSFCTIDTSVLPAGAVEATHRTWINGAGASPPFMAAAKRPFEMLVSLSSGAILRLRPHDATLLQVIYLRHVNPRAHMEPIAPLDKNVSPIIAMDMCFSPATGCIACIDSTNNLSLLHAGSYGWFEGTPAMTAALETRLVKNHVVLDADTNSVPGAGPLSTRPLRWRSPSSVAQHTSATSWISYGPHTTSKRKRTDAPSSPPTSAMQAEFDSSTHNRLMDSDARAVLPLGVLRHNHARSVTRFTVEELQRGVRENSHSLSGVTSGAVNDSTMLTLERLAAEQRYSLVNITVDATSHNGRYAAITAIRHSSRLFAAATIGGTDNDTAQQQQPAVMIPGVYVVMVVDLQLGLVVKTIPISAVDPSKVAAEEAMHGQHAAPIFCLPATFVRTQHQKTQHADDDLIVCAGGLLDTVYMFEGLTGELLGMWRYSSNGGGDFASQSRLWGGTRRRSDRVDGTEDSSEGFLTDTMFDALLDVNPNAAGAKERAAAVAKKALSNRHKDPSILATGQVHNADNEEYSTGADPQLVQDGSSRAKNAARVASKPFGVVNAVDAVQVASGAHKEVHVAAGLERGEVVTLHIM